MSKKARPPQNLPIAEPSAPPVRETTERIEIPAAGRADVEGLLRELTRFAFKGGLVGQSFELDRTGFRFFVTVRTHKGFSAAQVEAGEQSVLRTLIGLGIIRGAPAQPADEPQAEDGAKSPTIPQQSPSTSAE